MSSSLGIQLQFELYPVPVHIPKSGANHYWYVFLNFDINTIDWNTALLLKHQVFSNVITLPNYIRSWNDDITAI